MQALVDRIKNEGRHIGGGIIKIDTFLNHQVDPKLMIEVGHELADYLKDVNTKPITRVITAETSGIPVALSAAERTGVPMVYARKRQSLLMGNMDDFWHANAHSRTKNEPIMLWIDRQFLTADDHVMIVDDFLASGSTALGLSEIVRASGASVAGYGFVVEKPAEGGRQHILGQFNAANAPTVVSLAGIEASDTGFQVTGIQTGQE